VILLSGSELSFDRRISGMYGQHTTDADDDGAAGRREVVCQRSDADTSERGGVQLRQTCRTLTIASVELWQNCINALIHPVQFFTPYSVQKMHRIYW